MNFTRPDGQWPWPIEHAYAAGQIIMSPKVAIELRAMGLFDDENSFLSFDCGGEFFRLHWRE
jgi:hypothetical protein